MNKKSLLIGASIAIVLAVGVSFLVNDVKEKSKEQIIKKEFKVCSNSYNLHYSSDLLLSDPAQGVQKIVSEINSTLDFRIFDISNDEINVAFYIDPKSNTVNKQEQFKQATKELYNHIVLVKMDKTGKFIDYELSPNIHSEDESLLLSLIMPLQWSFHKEGKTVYTSQEVDVVGIYEADYNGTKKTKRNYATDSVSIYSSNTYSDILKNDCWHKNAVVRESLSYKKTATRPNLKTNTRINLTYVSSLDKNSPLMNMDKFDKVWQEYTKPTTAIRTVQEKYTNFSEYAQMKMDKVDLKDIISKLVEGSKHELEDQLLAYLLSDPTALDEIVIGIQNDQYDQYQMGIILRVIGKMNTPKAQIILSEVMIGDHTNNEQYRFWSAVELGKQVTVVPDIVKERLFEQLNYSGIKSESQLRVSAAIYSLGSISNNLKDKDPNYSDELNERLRSILNGTPNEESAKKAYLLGAISNTNSGDFLSTGKEYLIHSESDIRKRAVLITANSDTADATITLENTLLNEPDSLVKSTILESLARRAPEQTDDIRKEVIKLAKSKDSEIIRTSAINYLLIQLPPTKQNKEIFVELLEQETLMENVEKLVYKVKSIK